MVFLRLVNSGMWGFGLVGESLLERRKRRIADGDVCT